MATEHWTKLSSEIRPPKPGEVGVVNTSSTTAFTVDLRQVGPQAASMGNDAILPPSNVQNPPGAMGRFVEITAVGNDFGFFFGPTQGSVSGANAPVLANGATGANPVVSPAAVGNCARIFAGQTRSYTVQGDCFWLGSVCSSANASQLIIAVTSKES